jgi:hypothetical protein
MKTRTYKRKNGTYIREIKEYNPPGLYNRVFELEDSPVDINYIANNLEGEQIIKEANSSYDVEDKIRDRKDWKNLLSWHFTYKKTL